MPVRKYFRTRLKMEYLSLIFSRQAQDGILEPGSIFWAKVSVMHALLGCARTLAPPHVTHLLRVASSARSFYCTMNYFLTVHSLLIMNPVKHALIEFYTLIVNVLISLPTFYMKQFYTLLGGGEGGYRNPLLVWTQKHSDVEAVLLPWERKWNKITVSASLGKYMFFSKSILIYSK